MNTPRLLGAAFLVVFVASVIAMVLPQSLLSGSMSDNLIKISNNLTLLRVGILVELVTSAGIVVLAVLLYTVLHKQNQVIALVALGWWLAEAIKLAVSKVGGLCADPHQRVIRQGGSAGCPLPADARHAFQWCGQMGL